ncbi:NeuD/PglB/VioB family sugar acetyltransferase [Alphaproteobacteria bacterium]|jgi:sugar O-acyltransferase (sialic acid O-acetyltransferase NeuD family)|nr:NeuD/PglB/VioB family sugar acetyltransferase [Alphaproteobacteria bacterium]
MQEETEKVFVLVGAGGHASVVASTAAAIGLKISLVALPNVLSEHAHFPGVKYLTDEELISQKNNREFRLLNGIGKTIKSDLRACVFQKFKSHGFEFQKLIHPFAYVDPSSHLFEGVQVMAGAIVQNDCSIGENSIVNTKASVDHGCIIGSSSHIAPGAIICGDVSIGDNCFIGAGAVITEGTKIATGMVIKAGRALHCNGAQ